MKSERHLYFTTKKVGKAIWEHGMIREGDRVLIAVSGGKDSLALVRIMKERLRFVPIRYETMACHVDMGFHWSDSKKLANFFDRESVPYVILDPPADWKGGQEDLDCFWCSWNRRKAIFDYAHTHKYNRIAFAHHMDDIIETMLMNLFFQGEIGTMKPFQEMFEGELAIIRPLAYVEEWELAKLSSLLDLPVIASQCPRSDMSKRKVVKDVIGDMKKHNRNVKKNIFRSLQRVRKDYLLDGP